MQELIDSCGNCKCTCTLLTDYFKMYCVFPSITYHTMTFFTIWCYVFEQLYDNRGTILRTEFHVLLLHQFSIIIDTICSICLLAPIFYSESMALEDQFHHDSQLMRSLLHQEKVDSVLNPRLSLLPPDLQRQYEVAMVERGVDKDR